MISLGWPFRVSPEEPVGSGWGGEGGLVDPPVL